MISWEKIKQHKYAITFGAVVGVGTAVLATILAKVNNDLNSIGPDESVGELSVMERVGDTDVFRDANDILYQPVSS